MSNKTLNSLLALSAALSLVLALLIVHDLSRPVTAAGPAAAAVSNTGDGSYTGPGTDNSALTGPTVVSTTATGGPSGSSGSNTNASAGGATGSTTSKGDTTGITSTSIKVGGLFTETGAFDARPADYSVRAYFQTVNAAGGVAGRKLDFVSYDDSLDPTKGLQAVHRLVEQDRIFAMVGWLAPYSEPQAMPYLIQKGVPVIGGLGVPQEFGPARSYPTMANLGRAGLGVAQYICDMGVKKPVGIVVDLPYADQIAATATQGLKKICGITPLRIDKVNAATPDFTSYVVQYRSMGADSILIAFDPMSYTRLYQAMQRQSWKPRALTIAAADTERNAMISDALEGTIDVESQIVPYLHPNHAGAQRYMAAIDRYYPGMTIASVAQISWTAAQVFVEALRRMGTNITRERLISTLNSFRSFKTDLTAPLTYTATDHDAVHCIELLKWSKGKWSDYKPAFQCWNYVGGGAVKAPDVPFE